MQHVAENGANYHRGQWVDILVAENMTEQVGFSFKLASWIISLMCKTLFVVYDDLEFLNLCIYNR